MRKIWHNGVIKNESEAKISVYDAGCMQIMAFEMTRSFNKVHFKLKEHLERLFNSAKYLNILIPYTIKQLMDVCNQLIIENSSEFEDDDEHRLLINVSAGALSIYKDVIGTVNGTNIMITDFPLRWPVSGMGKYYDSGLGVIVPNQKTIPSYLMENRVKNHCRMHALKANIECSNYNGDNWALLTTPDGYITEGTGANIFLIKDGILYTPKTTNILSGISRKYVMTELAEDAYSWTNFPVIEKDLLPYDFIIADEVFFTGTPFCILPVVSFNGSKIGDGKPGRITKMLINTWSRNVGVNIPEQIKMWDKKYKTDMVGSTPYQFTKKI